MNRSYPRNYSFQRLSLLGLLVWSILAGASPALAAAPAGGPEEPAELEAFFDGLMAAQMAANHLPGAVVSVVKDGQVFFSKGYGYADLETHSRVDVEQTLFRPGSVSKLFVWTAVMQLVESGQLALDADVNIYLDFAIPATYAEPITLANLLTHTPGFEDKNQELFTLKAEAMHPLGEFLKTHLPGRVFPPGQIGAYSNYGTALAGYIVERVSGQPFEAYVEEHILIPLGMTHSTFRQPLPDSLAPDMAQGYNFVNGSYLSGSFEYVQAYPAGSMSVTATDMARFMIAHLQNGRYGETRILQEATARRMHSQLFTHDPRLDGMAHGFFENVYHGYRIISHGGDTTLFHTGLFLIPEENVGLFVSTNGAGGAANGAAVFEAFMDRYYPAEPSPALQPPADFASRIAPYQGEYIEARSNFTTLEKFFLLFAPVNVSLTGEGYLTLTTMGVSSQYVEIEPGLLQNRDEPAERIVYRADAAGQRYLVGTGPFALIQSPWYGTTLIHGLIFGLGAALFIGALGSWSIGGLKSLRRRTPQPWQARLAHGAGACFGLSYLVFLILLAVLLSDIIPAFGIPRMLLEDAPLLHLALGLPWLMALAGAAMLVFTALAWGKRFWTPGSRVSYTLLTLLALALLWALYYWNLLL